MSKLPPLSTRHKICVICEGYEDTAYFNRLIALNVWDPIYEFILVNAKSASNIFARYQDAFQNDKYELILIFCDTDKSPYKEYSLIKSKINEFHGQKRKAHEKIVIFANPCTMQIILSHFGDVSLKNQGKKTNSKVIESLTGIKDYDAHENQINEMCNIIFQRTYQEMKARISNMDYPDTTSGSTNFIHFLDKFESSDPKWIDKISQSLS